jgi:hypothetical protein
MAVPSSAWDSTWEATPADAGDPEQGADNIRDSKLYVRERLEREHEGSITESTADKSYDGTHRKGSARAFVVDADPAAAAWPDGDGVRALETDDVHDDGRLWFDSGDGYLPALWAETDDDPETHGWVGCIREVYTWHWQGVLATTAAFPRILIPHKCEVLKIGAVVANAPTGSATTLNVHKAETAAKIASSDLSLAAGTGVAKASTSTLSATNKELAAEDVLRLEIVSVGSTTPGSDLMVYVEVLLKP